MGRFGKTSLLLLVPVLLLAFVACGPKGDDESDSSNDQLTPTTVSSTSPDPQGDKTPVVPSGGDGNTSSTPSSSGGDESAVIQLPRQDITFSVNVPRNTPDDAPIYLSVFDIKGGLDRHIRMKNLGGGVYQTSADMEIGSILRYAYDRFDGEGCCQEFATREALGELFSMQYRFLLIEEGISAIEDSVGTWVDLREDYDSGSVSGTVIDATTGQPVLDADVSISGVHIGSRVDGTFTVNDLPFGQHSVLVHSNTGDFLPVQQIVELDSDQGVNVRVEITPSTLVEVEFEVELPESTPESSWIKLGGTLHQLGARDAHPARPLTPSNLSIPLLERNESRATATFHLPVGAHFEYFYTIGPIGVADEKKSNGQSVIRSLIVPDSNTRQTDIVESWVNVGWPLLTLRVQPPPGTPEDERIVLNMGPSSWLEPAGDGTFTTVLGSWAPGWETQYRYVLGDDHKGMDGSPGLEDGWRTVTFPEEDGEHLDVITRWEGQRDRNARRPDGSLEVTFRVSVPPETPRDAEIWIAGNRPALGDGVQLQQSEINPWLYEATVEFGHTGDLHYKYELRSEQLESFGKGVFTEFDGQVVNDWVVKWPGIAPKYAVREGFSKGVYTPDFFSESFTSTSESTYERIADIGADTVVISSIWSYGTTHPVPTLKYRPVVGGSVATPIEDALLQAQLARDAGLKIFFGPQFNMEQAVGGSDSYNQPKDEDWWSGWLLLADEMWTWNATVAEIIQAEYMMVPGPLFHVYEYIDKPSDDPFIVAFEVEQQRLIEKIRSIYSGEILISGSNKNYEFPGLADYNGVTTYDVGVPTLPADTTFDEYIEYYESQFAERVDTVHERWGNPTFFYTVHARPTPTESDPSGEYAQAAALEALFQAIAERPEIAGSLSWSYSMVDAPLLPDDGVRGRLGEAVLAKWYTILGG